MRTGTGKHIRISAVLGHLPSLSLFQRLSWQTSSLYICSSSIPSSLVHLLRSLQPEFWLAWLIPTTLLDSMPFAACLMDGGPVSDRATLGSHILWPDQWPLPPKRLFSSCYFEGGRWAMATVAKWNNKWNRNIAIHGREPLTVLVHVTNKQRITN